MVQFSAIFRTLIRMPFEDAQLKHRRKSHFRRKPFAYKWTEEYACAAYVFACVLQHSINPHHPQILSLSFHIHILS